MREAIRRDSLKCNYLLVYTDYYLRLSEIAASQLSTSLGTQWVLGSWHISHVTT